MKLRYFVLYFRAFFCYNETNAAKRNCFATQLSNRRLKRFVIIDEMIFRQGRPKAQVILYVLPSILDDDGGKTAAENYEQDLSSDYTIKRSVLYVLCFPCAGRAEDPL